MEPIEDTPLGELLLVLLRDGRSGDFRKRARLPNALRQRLEEHVFPLELAPHLLDSAACAARLSAARRVEVRQGAEHRRDVSWGADRLAVRRMHRQGVQEFGE